MKENNDEIIIFDLDTLFKQLSEVRRNKKKGEFTTLPRKKHYTWYKSHYKCIQNYQAMKESRKRIIQQRDKLQKENDYIKRRLVENYDTFKKENKAIIDKYREERELAQYYNKKYNDLLLQIKKIGVDTE